MTRELPGRLAALPSGTPLLAADDDVFTSTYAALLTVESGARVDLSDLRARVERFRSVAGRSRIPAERSRWVRLAAALDGALEELEAGSPDRARRELDLGLRRYIAAPVAEGVAFGPCRPSTGTP